LAAAAGSRYGGGAKTKVVGTKTDSSLPELWVKFKADREPSGVICYGSGSIFKSSS